MTINETLMFSSGSGWQFLIEKQDFFTKFYNDKSTACPFVGMYIDVEADNVPPWIMIDV